MATTVHPPPAGIDDFARRPDMAEAMAQGWDAIVNDWLDGAAGYYGDETNPSLFYNAQRDDTPGAGATDDAVWDAFPLAITKWFAGDDDPERTRWRAADTPRAYPGRYRRVVDGRLGEPIDLTHRQQDEYCEWFAVRDGEAIRRITFTSEAPEYWMYLAHGTPEFLPQGHPDHDRFAGDMSLVEELYQEHVDPSATVQDLTWPYDVAQAVSTSQGVRWLLRPAGSYNPFNKWNTTLGAMHLTHPANTLGAEINLAGGATVRRIGPDPDDPQALICCSQYGDANRSSDPIIGAKVYEFASQGLSVSLPDPVGLYIQSYNQDLFAGPAGESLERAWTVTRGDQASEQVLRLVFEVPEDLGFTVEDVQAGGFPVQWGGQVADAVKIHLTGMAKDLGVGGQGRAVECPGACCEDPDRPGVVAVVDVGTDCAQIDWTRFAPVLEQEQALAPVAQAVPPPEGDGTLVAFAVPDSRR